MEADIGQAGSAADAMPRVVKRLRRAPGIGRREDPRVSLGALQPLQEGDGLAVQGDLSRFARLGLGNQQFRRRQSICSHLVWVISLRRAPVSRRRKTA